MNTLSILLTISMPALAAETSFDRTLATSAHPTVSVMANSGNIHLHPGSDAQLHVYAKMHSNRGFFGNDSDVEKRMRQIANNPPIRQAGDVLTIGERNHDDLYRNISIDYDVTLPRGSAIDAESGSGDIMVEDAGIGLRAHTGSGNIRASHTGGPANLDTGSGDIELTQGAAGEVRASTGSGNIRLEGLSAGLKADTGSGDVTVGGTPAMEWRVQTGSGDIHLNLGSKAHFNLDANTGSGSVHTEQPIAMQGTIDKHHVRGAVNGGGPTLRLGTGSGDIEIR